MSFDFFPNEQGATLLNAARKPSTTPEPGMFENFAKGAGMYTMRSLAEAGRAVDLTGAVFPIAYDAVVGGTEQQDQYFKEHDEVFNSAVDYWTPKPGEVGTAGQVAGQLAGGVMQAIVSPALLVGTTQLSASEDLVRNGVDSTTAQVVGGIQGASMAVGLKLPYLGQTLATRVLSGAGGNLVQGTAGALASSEVLKAEGYDKQAEQFNPWDLRARALDVMLGAAFGGLAHIDAKGKLQEAPKLTPTDEAALLVANQARHLEDVTPQGRPATDADATMHADAMRRAIDQVLRGEQVTVDDIVRDMRLVPDEAQYQQRAEIMAEAQRIAEQVAPFDPIVPKMEATRPLADNIPVDGDPASIQARRFATEQPDLTIPTNRADADGNPVTMRAADAIALADAEVAHTQATAANLFKTAANCLLGAL
jgi:hypothetical protein